MPDLSTCPCRSVWGEVRKLMQGYTGSDNASAHSESGETRVRIVDELGSLALELDKWKGADDEDG